MVCANNFKTRAVEWRWSLVELFLNLRNVWGVESKMEGEKDEDKEGGLPEIYLSPSRKISSMVAEASQPASDTEPEAWDDTDTETWTSLLAEATLNSRFTSLADTTFLGQREEIEGGSSQESQNTSLVGGQNPNLESLAERAPVGMGGEGTEVSLQMMRPKKSGKDGRLSGQRGETPGSDCPSTANLGVFARALRRPLLLDTQVGVAGSSELVFSPGGDQGFMVVPAPLTSLGDSGSDTEVLDWVAACGALGGVPTLVPVRDVVEGADSASTPARTYGAGSGGLMAVGGIEGLERNSPAGLSTPDGELDLSVASERTVEGKKAEVRTVRPPVVGQSEEVEVVTRKDLGSTDGEESSDEGQTRSPARAPDIFGPTDVQPGSLGSQSENTDSVKTVVDLNRVEGQGCETDPSLSNPGLMMAQAMQLCPKPSFVVGGPISPRGKFKQFQNTVRDRMQDMKASLETQEAGPELDRDRYLAQPPLYPPIPLVNDQEISLASMVSVESTNPPESSERVTSPSVLSVSSAASSRRMEWDSGADVGYSGGITGGTPESALTSLSTLERIAIGSYASVLRTEPEGTTQVRERQRVSKRDGRVGLGRLGGQPGSGRLYPTLEGTTSSSTHSSPAHRVHKVCLSSSEEDINKRFGSPSQSPRRRPRKRSGVIGSRDGDLPQKRTSKNLVGLGKRLRELTHEQREGKSSSLVELGQFWTGSVHNHRSNSQYSLSLPHHLSDTFKMKSVRSGINRGMVGTANTSTSTSTLIPSVSPRPASASTSSTQVADVPVGPHSPTTTDSKHSSLASLAASESLHAHPQVSSSNDLSPRSHESSDLEVQGELATVQDKSASHYHHPHNLKAKKNSENARNHESLQARQGEQEQVGVQKGKEQLQVNPACASSSNQSSTAPVQSEVEGQMGDNEGESLQASNAALQSLSVRLLARIQALGKAGCLGEGRDYHKLRDYATFIGVPATTEEERRLRQGVANVIMHMFGEIGGLDHTSDTSPASDTLYSDTFPSDTLLSAASNTLPSDTLPSDTLPTGPSDASDTQSGQQRSGQYSSEPVVLVSQDLDQPHSSDGKKSEDVRQNEVGAAVREHKVPSKAVYEEEEEERCITPGGTVLVVPYRPPSATRTYYMAVSHEHGDGLVEAKQAPDTCIASSPDPSHPSITSPLSRCEADVTRGQAEGWREEAGSPSPLISSLTTHREGDPSEYNWLGSGQSGWTGEDGNGAVAREWWSERPPLHSPPSSDDWSPLHQQSSWQLFKPTQWQQDREEEEVRKDVEVLRETKWWGEEEDKNADVIRERAAAEWWAGRSGTGRLYKDRQGMLHLAQQPPGYQEDRDSHPSESLSDQEHRRPAAPRPPWTSSGSESAYETIRERHRRVDEALASSFEFYSTSPRPARLVPCTPPSEQDDDEMNADVDDGEEDSNTQDNIPLRIPSPSSVASVGELDSSLTSSRPKTHTQHPPAQSHSLLTSRSSYTEGNDVSSQISLIQMEKQRHVRKIQRHILTLEKLERALLEQLGDSLGSEGSFQKRLMEESDKNIKGRHNIVEQSETGTSSLMSSDYSERMNQNRKLMNRTVNQETTRLTTGDAQDPLNMQASGTSQSPSSPLRSHSPSPCVNVSQYSSDLTSSRASTMRQVENEVRRLASAEEKSRRVLQRVRGTRHETRETRQDPHTSASRSKHKEAARGQHKHDAHSSATRSKNREGARVSNRENICTSSARGRNEEGIRSNGGTAYHSSTQDPIIHAVQKSASKYIAPAERESSRHGNEGTVHWRKGAVSRNQQPTSVKVLVEDEQRESDEIEQREIGREGKNQICVKINEMDNGSDGSIKAFTHDRQDARSSAASSVSGSHARNNKHRKDFTQMFPSSESILLGGCLNVGIQTGDSLLYPSRRGKEVGNGKSSGSSSSSGSPAHTTSTENDGGRYRKQGKDRKNEKYKTQRNQEQEGYITSSNVESIKSSQDQDDRPVSLPESDIKPIGPTDNQRDPMPQSCEIQKCRNVQKVGTNLDKPESKMDNRRVRERSVNQRKEAWSESSRERSLEIKRPGSGKSKNLPEPEQSTKISSRPCSGKTSTSSRTRHTGKIVKHTKRDGRGRIDKEPSADRGDMDRDSQRENGFSSDCRDVIGVKSKSEEEKFSRVETDKIRINNPTGRDKICKEQKLESRFRSAQDHRHNLESALESESENSSSRGGNAKIGREKELRRDRVKNKEREMGNKVRSARDSRGQRDETPSSKSAEERSATSNGSEYSSWSETVRDKCLPFTELESSESTSTGEVGEAELDEKTARRDRRHKRHVSGRMQRTATSQEMQHSTNHRTQPTLPLIAGVEKYPVNSMSLPPGMKQGAPADHLGYVQIHSERNVIDHQVSSEYLPNSQNRMLSSLNNQEHARFMNITHLDPQEDAQRAKRQQRGVREQSATLRTDLQKYKNPVRFDVVLDDKENFQPRQIITADPAAVGVGGMSREKRVTLKLSLQEALARAKPRYVQEANDRHALIHLKKEMRQSAQQHNHQLVAQIPPNLQTPSTLQRFLYKPELSPIFSYRDMRQQNRRLYDLLPESGSLGLRHQRLAENRTNRLMANLYSQRLRKKVKKGQVSHAHKEIVTPISTRVHPVHRPTTRY
ncbi:hypothetical protein Pcinc_004344 [Petrolisthes cinctipes]|uniref:ALMS motif domain-containing protein n=1 Tax=Petrolisthes cinctipes TaxID=88211 RepID=A0AAE1GEW2_PETCI|nr:hypothetical protein Pcinc_004344 [Petrolisthes cinctipes]